jgi:hypothetical protein
MASKLFDVNSGQEFTPSKANSVMKGESPLSKSGASKSKGSTMDVNQGSYSSDTKAKMTMEKASVKNDKC